VQRAAQGLHDPVEAPIQRLLVEAQHASDLDNAPAVLEPHCIGREDGA